MRRIDLLLPWLITLLQCACQNPGPKTTRPLAFWAVFSASAKQPGLQQFRNIALDSLLIGDTLLNTQSFITRCFSEVIDSPVLQRLNDTLGKAFTTSDVELENLRTVARKLIIKVKKKYRLRQVLVARITDGNSPPVIRFDFIETRDGFRLYAIDHHWFQHCCR